MKLIRIKIRRFIARYLSGIVNFFYKQKIHFLDFLNNPPVIILNPGKVGSASVYYTLKRQLSYNVFHIHYLSEKGIEESKRLHLSSDRKSLPLHLIVSQLLRKKLKSYNGKVNIITIVREPISREISAYFQNTEFFKSTIENKRLEVDVNKTIEILNKIFDKDICHNLKHWFDQEIKSEFDVDVFSEPFNENDGYNIYRNNKCNLLLLKMETMNKVFPTAIKEFLNLEKPIPLIESNIGEDKFYADSYKLIKKQFRLEKEIINKIIESNYFQFFYSNKTDEVISKWLKE